MNYVTKALSNMKAILISFLILILLTSSRGDHVADSEAYLSQFIADLWLESVDVMKIIWKDCAKKLVEVKDVIDYKDYFPKFIGCMKRKTLRVLDRSFSSDIVPIADGINLVRFELVDGTGNAILTNISSSRIEKQIEKGEWSTLALQRIADVLRTHVIKIDFDNTKILDKEEFRGRRRHHMMTMMMFGIVSIGMVLVPMGFQFLAVLGGKALLLAKMALILASIQGLRKITSSPLNYGFYQPYPFEHYEKRSIDEWTSPTKSIIPSSQHTSSIIHTLPSKSEFLNVKINTENNKESNNRTKIKKPKTNVIWKSNIVDNMKVKHEAKVYPVYPGSLLSIFSGAYAPTLPIVDFTTSPGEVQADYTLELPFNRLRFQSSTPVVPS